MNEYQSPTLYHLDENWSCLLHTVWPESSPGPRLDVLPAIVRLPVYAVSKVTRAGGARVVWQSNASMVMETLPSLANTTRIVGWRTVLVMIGGCSDARSSGCGQTDKHPDTGDAGAEVLILDLTPLIRSAPLPVQVGLDGRNQRTNSAPANAFSTLESPHPGASFDFDSADTSVAANLSKITELLCANGPNTTMQEPTNAMRDEAVRHWPRIRRYSSWEAGFFSSYHRRFDERIRNSEEAAALHPPDKYYCLNAPPLRWHVLRGLGSHIKRGLYSIAIEEPPSGLPWLWPPRKSEVAAACDRQSKLENDKEMNLTTASDHAYSSWLCEGFPSVVAHTGNLRGIHRANVWPIGRHGLFADLASVSLLGFGGRVGDTMLSGKAFLELMAVVPLTNATLTAENAYSSAEMGFDAATMFLGAWRSGEEAGGKAPAPVHSMGFAAIPVPSRALSPWRLFPTHPLSATAIDSDRSVLPSEDDVEAVGLSNWHWLADNAAWGSRSDGHDLAFLTPGGFAQAPDASLRIGSAIRRERIARSEQWLVIAGGCLQEPYQLWQLFPCADIGSVLEAPLDQRQSALLQALSKVDEVERREVSVFSPSSMSWLPPSTHQIANLPHRLSAHALVSVGKYLITMGGHQSGLSSLFVLPLAYDLEAGMGEWVPMKLFLRATFLTQGCQTSVPMDPPGESHFHRLLPGAVKIRCPSWIASEAVDNDALEDCLLVVGGTSYEFDFGGGDPTLRLFPRRDVLVLAPSSVTGRLDPLSLDVWSIQEYCVAPTEIPCVGQGASVTGQGSTAYAVGGVWIDDSHPGFFSSTKASLVDTLCVIDAEHRTMTRRHVQQLEGGDNTEVGTSDSPAAVVSASLALEGQTLLVTGGSRLEGSSTTHAIDLSTFTSREVSMLAQATASALEDGGLPWLLGGDPHPLNPSRTLDTATTSQGLFARLLPDFGGTAEPRPRTRMATANALWEGRLYGWGGVLVESRRLVGELNVVHTGSRVAEVYQSVATEVRGALYGLEQCLVSTNLTLEDPHFVEELPGFSSVEAMIHASYLAPGGLFWQCVISRAASFVGGAPSDDWLHHSSGSQLWLQVLLDWQNTRCELHTTMPCGSLSYASDLLQRPADTFRDVTPSLRAEVVVVGTAVSQPFAITSPFFFRAANILRRTGGSELAVRRTWIVCEGIEGDSFLPQASSCLDIATGVGIAPQADRNVVLTGISAVPASFINAVAIASTAAPSAEPPVPLPLFLWQYQMGGLRFLSCEASAIEVYDSLIFGFSVLSTSIGTYDEGQGGAFLLQECGTRFQAVDVVGGLAREGGAAFISGGSFSANASSIVYNHATVKGGGLAVSCGELSAKGSVIAHNCIYPLEGEVSQDSGVTGGGGGIVCIGEREIRVETTLIAYNTVGRSGASPDALGSTMGGGGVLSIFCPVAVQQSLLYGNIAGEGGGGAVKIVSGILVANSTVFHSNAAYGKGGGVFCDTCEAVHTSNASFVKNSVAPSSGDALLATSVQEPIGGGGLAVLLPTQLSTFNNTAFALNEVYLGHGGAVLLLGGAEITQEQWYCVDTHGDLGSSQHCLSAPPERLLDHFSPVILLSVPVACHEVSLFNNTVAGGGGGAIYLFGSTGVAGVVLQGNDTAKPVTVLNQRAVRQASVLAINNNHAVFGAGIATQATALKVHSPRCLSAQPHSPLSSPIEASLHDALDSLVPSNAEIVAAEAFPVSCLGFSTHARLQLLSDVCGESPAFGNASHHGTRPCDIPLPLIGDALVKLGDGSAVFTSTSVPLPPGEAVMIRLRLRRYEQPSGNRAIPELEPTAEASLGFPSPGEDIVAPVIMVVMEQCPMGYTYVTNQGCQPCPAGTYYLASAVEVGDESSCHACPKGTYSAMGSSFCSPCLPGTFSGSERSPSCSPCPSTAYSGLGWSRCFECPV